MTQELTTTEKLEYVERKAKMKIASNEALHGIMAFNLHGSFIKQNKLYRNEYPTFEEFCQQEFEITPQHANRLLKAHEVLANLKANPVGSVLPSSERQLRELSTLPKDQQANAWKETLDTAPESKDGSPKVTAQHVAATVKRISAGEAKRPTPSPPTQDVIDVREVRKAFTILTDLPYSGDRALEKYGFEAFGPKAEAACDWMMDLIGAHRGQVEISIRLNDGTHFHPNVADMQLWQRSFPMLDVEQQLREIAVWNDGNPSKRKTHKGIKKHIASWLTRAAKDTRSGANDSGNEFEQRAAEL